MWNGRTNLSLFFAGINEGFTEASLLALLCSFWCQWMVLCSHHYTGLSVWSCGWKGKTILSMLGISDGFTVSIASSLGPCLVSEKGSQLVLLVPLVSVSQKPWLVSSWQSAIRAVWYSLLDRGLHGTLLLDRFSEYTVQRGVCVVCAVTERMCDWHDLELPSHVTWSLFGYGHCVRGGTVAGHK